MKMELEEMQDIAIAFKNVRVTSAKGEDDEDEIEEVIEIDDESDEQEKSDEDDDWDPDFDEFDIPKSTKKAVGKKGKDEDEDDFKVDDDFKDMFGGSSGFKDNSDDDY